MSRPSHIIAIGASAGGLEALRQMLSEPLQGTSFALVIIQHLSPNHTSLMPEILAKITDLPFVTIQDGQSVEAGHIYLIPAGFRVKLNGWTFVTEPADPLRRVLHLPINIFFRSAADQHKEKVVGVILSGTGSDGAAGMLRIREQGGLAVIQSPETCQFDGMPKAALETVRPDFVLAPQDILREIRQRFSGAAPAQDDESLTQIFRILSNRVGMDYSCYKAPTLVRRLKKRMAICNSPSFSEYADLLTLNAAECQELAKDFLISVTQFFRDPEVFEALYSTVILRLVQSAKPGEALRIWVPACATGQEAYTLAILLLEAQDALGVRVPFKIFATDLDASAVQVASRGLYPKSAVASVPEHLRAKYLNPHDQGFSMHPKVRERILFAPQDVINAPPFRHLHLISCRNSLIYFQQSLQVEILKKFRDSLIPGGYLLLGSSESVSGFSDGYEVVHGNAKIFRRPEHETGSSGSTQWPSHSPLALERMMSSVGAATSSHTARNDVATRVPESLPIAALLEATLGAGVVVNEKQEVVHCIGDVSRYFAHPAGEATCDALKLARPPYRGTLRSVMDKLQSNQNSAGDRVFETLLDPTLEQTVHVRAVRFFSEGQPHWQAFIGFSNTPTALPSGDQTMVNTQTGRVANLEDELVRTNQRLQDLLGELERINQDLQSTNEEFLSANEELQSNNEELQAVNEELHVINAEHQLKIEEVIELNNDVDDVLRDTEVGILFLDDTLSVRKYTQAVTKYIHVLERDVGRSVRHLALRMRFPGFTKELENVLMCGQRSEWPIQQNDSDLVVVRMVPSGSVQGIVRGVTVLFTPFTSKPKKAWAGAVPSSAGAQAPFGAPLRPTMVTQSSARSALSMASRSFSDG